MQLDNSGDADLLLTNGTIVTVDPDRRVLDNAAVAVSKGRILKIGPTAELKAQYRFASVLDCSDKAILPGLIDLHGYLGWSIMKSLGEGLDEVKIRDLYERILSQLTDEEWWMIEAQMCALDRVKFGTTFMFSMMGGNGTRTDDPIFTRIAAQGLSQVGVRARIGVGPARPPWPRVYSRWDSAGLKTNEEVSFDRVIDNCDKLLGEPAHPSGLIEYCTALSRFGNRNPHDPVWSQDREQWVRRQAEDRRVLPPGKALEMATIDGARALGLDREIGSIEVGKKADLITIDLRQPHLYPPDMIPMRLVTNGSGKDVNDVVIDGRIVMRDRVMTTVDENAVLDQAVAMYHRTIERGSLQETAKIHDRFWSASSF